MKTTEEIIEWAENEIDSLHQSIRAEEETDKSYSTILHLIGKRDALLDLIDYIGEEK